MRVVCPWCREEGRPAFLHERDPLDDPGETSGICLKHKESILSTLPSRSFPKAKLLLVVNARETDLFSHLERTFAAVADVAVILERRQDQRRRASREVEVVERRKTERRLRRGESHALGYTVVRFRRRGTTPPVQ